MESVKQKTILLVEDEAIIAMAEKMTLEKFGYNVIIAGSGEEAVATVAQTPDIDLILMDIDLGAGMDGTEAAAMILQRHDLPIVFLSGHTEPEIVARTEKITSYGYVVKNSSATVFQALIKMVFKLFEAKAKEKRKEHRGTDALESLRESEERFHSFFDNSNAGIYRTAPDGSIHLANPALIRMLGYSSFADLGDKDLNKTGFEPSYPRTQFVAKIEKDGEVMGLESVWKRKDGTTIIVRESARAIRDAQGKTLYYDGIVEDITEIKRSEKLTAAFYGISQAMFDSGDLDELYPRIHGLIAGIVPANNFFIALLMDDSQVLKFPYYRDEKDTSSDEVIKTDDPQSLTVEVLRTKKPLLLDEAQLGERYASGRNRVWGTAPKCWLGVPLRIRDRAIGVMVIQDYNDGSAYSQGDVILLESTAGQIAIAIDRKRAESQREAALKALSESEAHFHSLFDNMDEGVALHELVFAEGKPANYRIIDINNRFLKIIGVSREQVIGKLSTEAYGTLTPPYFEEYAGVGISKKPIYFETYFASLNMHLAISVAPWRENGFATIFSNISERKRAEEEIKRQLAEKEVLLREVHHRIKNNIASISGILSLRLRSIANPEAAAALQDAIGRVDSMRILYDKLLLSTGYQDIQVKNYVVSLIDMVVAQFPGDTRIALDKRIDDFPLDPKRLFPLGIIINELLTNIMKYAFSGRETGSIQFSLVRANGRVTLTIQDDGRGLPAGFDPDRSGGFGLMLVKMLSQQLAGRFSIENRAGTRCVVEFNA